MKKSIFLLLFPCFLFIAVPAQKTERTPPFPYASSQPVSEPSVFGAGVISTGEFDSHPAFTPDGKTLYFVRSTPNFNFWTILVSHFKKGRWTEPEVAPFSGQYPDADPFITPDGRKFYFISSRPAAGKKTPGDMDVYVMERTAKGDWSEPRNLGAPVNSDGAEWHPTVAASGAIYFGSDRAGGKGKTDLYRCLSVNGKYREAENLGDAVNTQLNEFEPMIAADESFLIFMGGGRAGGRGGFDLYISYNRGDSWTEPVNLGDKINSAANEYSPVIAPGGRYFFWTSARSFTEKPLEKRLGYRELMDKLNSPQNGLGDIYQIDIGELKIAGRQQQQQ